MNIESQNADVIVNVGKQEVDVKNLQPGHVILWQPVDLQYLPVVCLVIEKTEHGYKTDIDGSTSEARFEEIVEVLCITPGTINLANSKE